MIFAILATVPAQGQPALDHPAIHYYDGPLHDPVALLDPNQLKFEGPSGYLRSVLDALHVPVGSQIAVFSKTSLQSPLIGPRNPRTIFFNDSVAVGWMGGGFIELAAQDPQQGTKFYTLQQRPSLNPSFQRGTDCLRCHLVEATLEIPGLVAGSVFTAPNGAPIESYGGTVVDHRTPLEERWGGWFVTGAPAEIRHRGNSVMGAQADSDVVALLVFDHQRHMANLITRIGWDTRAGMGKLAESARELVDYLLFVDEAPLTGKLGGPFAEAFGKNAVRDSKGRSLRDLDLQTRLLRYPCSYMIYSEAFDALPAAAKNAIYKRMRQVLSGSEKDKKYARLSADDRRAILEILRETKPEFARVVN